MNDTERQLYVAVAATVAALMVLIWLTGALAGLLFGSGWTPIGASDLGATALRLPSHLSEPRDAWPHKVRSALPGAVGIYASVALISGAITGLALLVRRALLPVAWPQLGGARRRVPAARWATLRDLALLRVREPQPGRLTLGRHGRALLAAEKRQSVIAFAPTGTHKTSGLVIPALLEWQGPALVTTVKGDVLPETIERREQLGEVMVFDPTGVSGVEPSTRATPLEAAKTWRDARKVAHWLCNSAQGSKGGLQDADFWFATAEKLLAPLLLAAATSRRTMADVVRWLDEGPDVNPAQVGKALKKAGEPAAERAWRATQNREERQRSSVYTTAEMVVAAFADERVQQETEAADYTPARLLNGEMNTLYLCAPLDEQERLCPVFSAIVQELVAFAYRRAAVDGPLEPSLLLLLDEAANIAPFPGLDSVASTGASQGLQLLSIFQDMAQLATVYGRRSPTIVNNHRGKWFGVGISDPETLTFISRVAGVAEFEQRSRNTGEKGRRSRTEGETYRDLAPANLVRERELATALLLYHNLPLAKIDLRLWFEDQGLMDLQRGASTADPMGMSP
ncbi:MAG TPA: type IV secretory system conjugative DNA transfer family protein [Solirubrobacterales bacterium]